MFFIHPNEKQRSNHKMSIKINNTNIVQVKYFKFLGVHVDEELNWKMHMDKKATQISKVVGVMCKLRHFVPLRIIKTIYLSLVQSHLYYGLIIWGENEFAKNNRLNVLQKRAVRILSGSKYNSHTEPLFKREKLLKIQELYKQKCIKLYCSIIDRKCPKFLQESIELSNTVHSYNTRNATNVYRTHQHTKFHKQLINHKLSESWNMLSLKTKQEVKNKINPAKYVKSVFIDAYSNECHIVNSYICKNN